VKYHNKLSSFPTKNFKQINGKVRKSKQLPTKWKNLRRNRLKRYV